MFNKSYEEIVEKIKKEKNLGDDEINKRVREKLDQLSDLISKEGAVHIVANELGVKIFEDAGIRRFKISNILPGMSSVSVVGKVVKLYGVREYKKENREGKVANFLLADNSGSIRVVFWDTNHIKEIEDENLKEGSIIKIKNAIVRENQGFKEIHLSNRSKLIVNPEGEEIGEINLETQSTSFIKKQLKDLNENDRNIGVLGTIVQIFEPRFYEICPECGKRLSLEENKFTCSQHGIVKEKFVPVMNLFFDDGTESIRAVCFKDQVESLLKLNNEEILKFKENPEKFLDVKKEILGKQLMIIGRVVKNEMFNRLELVTQRVLEVNPKDIANELSKEVGVKAL